MSRPVMSRRNFTGTVLASAIAALVPQSPGREGRSPRVTALKESTRREVIKQRLPENPPRELTLIEVTYPAGAGSPPHMHAYGVMALVLSGAVASRVNDQPERVFHAGEAWWEPPGAVHHVSRNASSSEPARLLAIFIALPDATADDLMKPIVVGTGTLGKRSGALRGYREVA